MTAKTQKPDAPKTHAFQAEVQQLLHLMIHSLYANKEIFLRELIANAADACDKLRFAALTDKKLLEDDAEPAIWASSDAKAKSVTIRDNGIGMDYDEVIANIGTIAHSGTKDFLNELANKKQDAADDARFIGQFGVGFYSCFLVAEKVTLLTRKAGAPATAGVKWESNGDGEYAIETIEREARGTEIILTLKKDAREYLDAHRMRGVIAKYSNHISLPIYMPSDEKDKDAKTAWQSVNKGSALWARAKKDISSEEHNEFYTSLTFDPQPPAVVLHNRVEGRLEYISLFYIPAKAPFDLWDREQRHGVKLYVRRIFIADDAGHLTPNYLRFVRGLVDAADLPLNVSREFLQQNAQVEKIRAASVKKILAELKKIADKDTDKYQALWREYGRVLKEGVIEDPDNKDAIAKLLRFASTHAEKDEQAVSLDDYVARMADKQKAIYYVTAESFAAAKSSPHLEVFRKNAIEVLLLSDPVDEWLVNALPEYADKPLQSIAKGDLDLGELKKSDNDDDLESQKQSLKPLADKFKTALGDKVKDVRVSDRLVDSPACLVADQHDLGGNMQRILQAMGQDAPSAKPILEINPTHPIVKRIAADADIETWANVLFDQAALAEGATLKDPNAYVARVNKLLEGAD